MDIDTKPKLTKRKNEEVLVAESLDNTAPVKDIVNFLGSRRAKNKLNTYYCQMVRQRWGWKDKYERDYHSHFPALPLYAFTDDWDGGLNSGYFEEFSHKSLYPRIISKIFNIHKEDPLIDLIKKTYDWDINWRNYRRYFTVCGSKTYKMLSDDIMHCPKSFVDIAAHWEQKPDHYFDCSFNWYYSGKGNMHIVNIEGSQYMLYSTFTCMYLCPFNDDNLKIDYDNSIKFECGEDRLIFETIMSQNIIALRTKYKVFILKVQEVDYKLTIEKLKEIDSKLPFTGITFDEYHKNILYVTSLDYKLRIVNIDRMAARTKQLRGKVTSLVDNWSTVIGSERGFFAHVAKMSITMYDKRTNEPFQRWKSIRKLTDYLECNEITVAKFCEKKPLLYVGTDHHLFLVDMRYNKEQNNKLRTVQRWTHGMHSPPNYMSMCGFGYNKELICLASQWFEDMCVVSNYSDTLTRQVNSIGGVVIPYRPPSLLNTLDEAQRKLLCCNLYSTIDSRLCTAITGLSVIEQGDIYSVLMLNSLGDVSCHSLYPKNMLAFLQDDSMEQLHEWSKSYNVNEKVSEIQYSNIIDLRKMFKDLKRIPDDYKLGFNRSVKHRHKFSEQEILDAFDKEEVDPGLKEAWLKGDHDETKDDTQNETPFNLFFDE